MYKNVNGNKYTLIIPYLKLNYIENFEDNSFKIININYKNELISKFVKSINYFNFNKDNLPFISIIMTVYNSESTVEYSIKSILNQTYKNFEFLIIDDGSQDNSKNIILK